MRVHDATSAGSEHGFPLRLVEPHLFGCTSPKWLRAIDQEGGSPWL
ncbi:molybdopterin-dependent oxidoreductase [Streptomyces griseoruber]